jgi:hypothetical protein
MAMPETTCPQCGYSLETAGSVATTCPRCESALDFGETKAAPTPPAINLSDSSSPKIDVAGLMRRVLAEQRSEEDLDAALERIARYEYREESGKIVKLIQQFLTWRQQWFGVNRTEAAELLAKSTAQLTIMPGGNPFLEEIDVSQQGLEGLPPEYHQELLQQIEKSFREGKRVPGAIVASDLYIRGIDKIGLEYQQKIKEAIRQGMPIIQLEDLKPESRQQLLQLVERSLREGKSQITAGQEKVELADLKIEGMEKLPHKYQEQIRQQIEEAIREGEPFPTKITLSPVNLGKLSPRKVLIWTALLLGCLLLAYLLSLR